MRRFLSVAISAVTIILLYTTLSSADLIVMKNGDKLFGKIQNKHFALFSPYGQIVCGYDFLKSITFDDKNSAQGSLQTINNDLFSGTILMGKFNIILEDGEQRSISRKNIKRIRIDTRGPSHSISTGIITMLNKDKFSAKVITADFKIKTDYMVKLIQRDSINRVELFPNGRDNVKILLNNGDLIKGELLVEQIDVAPDTIGELTLGKSTIYSIQLNAAKMVLKEYHALPASDRDSDGDGIPDDRDNCPNSPWGFAVDQNGCSTDPNLAKGGNPFDSDHDGVSNDIDQCPDTPQGVPVDSRGCSLIRPVFFEFDKYDLRHKFYSELDYLVSMLTKNVAMKIQIQGHTDNVGPPEYNKDLSERRASEVKLYLTNKGIDPARISIIGYGSTRNKADNNTASGREQNRRAEIVIVK